MWCALDAAYKLVPQRTRIAKFPTTRSVAAGCLTVGKSMTGWWPTPTAQGLIMINGEKRRRPPRVDDVDDDDIGTSSSTRGNVATYAF